MGMTSVTVATCDRCGRSDEFRRAEDGYSWAGINYSETNGYRWIGSQRSQKPKWVDLCPDCSGELHDWWLLKECR